MKPLVTKTRRRGTILLMIVGLLAMLFVVVSAYIVLARFDRQALGFVRQGTQVSRIIDSIHDVLAAEIRGPRTTPGASVTGAAYVDTPAYYDGDPNLPTTKVRGAPWLASPEPVRVPAGGTLPGDYRYPTVSGASGKVSGRRLLTDLMYDAREVSSAQQMVVGYTPLTQDTIANAREPFMDADGDGIPDSYFGSVSVLTELANALVGRSLRANDITPESLDWNNANDPKLLAWQQFSELARYTVAARIVSHGGMVQVSTPTDGIRWNSEFLGNMFNWVKYPGESILAPRHNAMHRAWLYDMWSQRGAVEPFLRRRGGLLAGYDGMSDQGVPPALWTLQSNYPYTFVPQYNFLPQYGTKEDNWQRFNLASLAEWNAWRRGATIDPVDYNTNPNVRRRWVPRQVLTTVNLSDELAREQGQWIDYSIPDNSLVFSRRYLNCPPGQLPPPGLWPGIEPGDVKYYLGRIRNAFNGSQNFVSDTNAAIDGYEVVRELVSYFSEMLAGHTGFPDLGVDLAPPIPPYSGRRLQQAYMLAVNTVAFAAPLVTVGYVDGVYATDPWGNTYIGYAPQPFITQVVAYNDPEDPNDPNSPPRIALAIELYNPHDSDATGIGSDKHALDLSRFAISINDIDPARVDGRLSKLGVWRLSGRTFLLCAAHVTADANTYFEDQKAANNLPLLREPVFSGPEFTVNYNPDTNLKVKLWRQADSRVWDSRRGWYLVDEMEVDNRGAQPHQQWYVNVRRDCTWEPYLGDWGGTARARWRMAVAFEPDDAEYRGSPQFMPPDQALLRQLGTPFDADGNDYGAHENALFPGLFGPAVPLHLMNAGAKYWPQLGGTMSHLHGTKRPESFPTVGFMLFIPRLSHMITSTGEQKPMSRLLRDLWRASHRGLGYSLNPADGRLPPVDFGHMPIFDNTQKVQSGAQKVVGEFEDTGRIPWGLLVFDYFTTLNPNDANSDGRENDALDPYRVEGRININAAPWYVLAGLPLLGPDQNDNLGISQDAAAAFWSKKSGGLVGTGADGVTQRYPLNLVYSGDRNNGQWYRLGAWLGQSIAAYRDRVQYTANVSGQPFFAEAMFRSSDPNDPHYLERTYRPVRYGDPNDPPAVRGGMDFGAPGAPTAKRGFLTVGELANVMGFDSWVWNGVPPRPPNTVLGPYFDGTAYDELGGDFMKAVSLLALLDTQFLTTRSNTFTVYLTLTDRQDPQASVRSQVTIDRSNLLPRLLRAYDSDNNGYLDTFITQEDSGLPETVGQREVSYFNARYDE